jgi:mannose-6-phosphate isomerase-like protein (cupin superfamily)
MPFEERRRGKLPAPGPYLAEVVNNLDPTYMGGLEVIVFFGTPFSFDLKNDTYVVKYLSPFAGNTSVRYEGTNSSDFNDVQKSYGFWAVPPDIGATVMVIFIDGDPNQGYWFGCVQDAFQNHMTPGLAATRSSAVTPEQKRRYGTDYLPTGEFLKSTQKLTNTKIEDIKKPVHPFAERLIAQGLLVDTIRGTTSSTARREVPSQVFGFSTPGPIDESSGARKGKVGYKGQTRLTPISRLGGSTFVMDDGDKKGQNELVRIRTRTGHQILLHNTHDLIYIANGGGTAWIELTGNGKIDIYAKDSVSIHSENDFNFRADRDINLEAGRNININSLGGIEINTADRFHLIAGKDGKIEIVGTTNWFSGKDMRMQSAENFNISSGLETKITSSEIMNLGAGGEIRLSSNVDIHFNGPAASPADAPELPVKLPTFKLPNRAVSAGWANGNFYKTTDITSIMRRVPTHEPWDHHENIAPDGFSPQATDAYSTGTNSISIN